jgi:signal transduction histidine kinase
MDVERTLLPGLRRSLSARLLMLTVLFVMLAEVLIFAPSIARFRLSHLREGLADAHTATLALDAAASERTISPALVEKLLAHARAAAVVRYQSGHPRRVVLGDVPQVIDATYDLRDVSALRLIWDAFVTLAQGEDRVMRVVGMSPKEEVVLLEVFQSDGPLRRDMVAYAWRILGLSVVISLFAAMLVYFSLHWLLVRPMRRLTENMAAFRDNPDDPGRLMRPSPRADEIGFAERELRTMQLGLRAALRQREHLAALGTAVAKINHDLKNALAAAQLVSDRLGDSADPQVRRVAPTLVRAIDRAVDLCGQTLDFARGEEIRLHKADFDFSALVDEVLANQSALSPQARLHNIAVRPFTISADRGQLDRALGNLVRNALQAGARKVTVDAQRSSAVCIDIIDDGPGLPEAVRKRLFEPFNSSRKGGMGLGMAIARDIVEAHGGSIRLVERPSGTQFRIELPKA